jgi:FkbM family methyltransferase
LRTLFHSVLSQVPRFWLERGARLLRRSPALHRAYRCATSSLKNRDGIVTGGPARGLSFNPGESDSRFLLGTFEPAVQEILAGCLADGMVCYDVGANVGFLSILAARLVGKRGEVHCFEPLPGNAAQIQHNARLNEFARIFVHAVALAQTDSTASFRVSERPTFGALSSSPIDVDKQTGTIEIPVRMLDSIVIEGQMPGPNLIKVDVEGSEIDFLAGAEHTIRRHQPVLVIELHGTNQGVAAWFQKFEYNYDVVGGGAIEDAPWAGLVVGTPKDRSEIRGLVQRICGKFSER